MKKSILTTLVSVAILGAAFGQQLKVKNYVEITKVSPKVGTAIGFENQYHWEYGAFFQESSLMESITMNESDRQDLPRHYEREFYGLYVAVPVIYREKYDVKVNIRTGVSNGENFLITTSFLADYNLSKNIQLGLGLGSRGFRPTMQGSVALKF